MWVRIPSGSRMLQVVFLLFASHFLFDYPLQGDAVARGKNRNADPALFGVPWPYWLTAHASCHALGVAVVTGSVALGLCELAAHWAIDFLKCEKRINIHVDQALHLVCKLTWAGYLATHAVVV